MDRGETDGWLNVKRGEGSLVGPRRGRPAPQTFYAFLP